MEKLYFCTDPRHTRPIGTECHPAEEDLAQGTHVMPLTNLEAGFFVFIPLPFMRQPGYSNQEGGCLGSGVEGQSPRFRNRVVETENPLPSEANQSVSQDRLTIN